MRGFTKLREDAVLPKRATKGSAGYDFSLPIYMEDVNIYPGETTVIPTGIAAHMECGEYLDLRIRSSLGAKGLIFCNGASVIDSDYYPNEIGVILHNLSSEVITVSGGMRICQGIFTEYEVVSDEEEIHAERTGGYGSTGEGSL